MSWQNYVDSNLVGTGNFTQGAIVGIQGGVWAATPGFTVGNNEILTLANGFKNPDSVRTNAPMVAGNKYMVVKADDRSIYGKLGKGGFCAVKTNQAIVIGVYGEGIQPGNAATSIEKLADYLIENSY
ncbi:profilin [Acrasis kona]|uniref:Profilin n=1 Tax=Acrasis kona TaxID=1008807 RepID=A0AAW2ZCD4_9EUKA